MATIKAMQQPKNGTSLKKPNLLEDLVAPRERYNVPNHLLDTKLFSKLSQNSVTKIEPSVVHFAGYKLNKVHKSRIRICNCSADRQNVHIIPPSSKYFTIQYTKPGRFVPGFTIEVTINFVPDEWRYYYDCIRIHCKDEENIVVPLHAFPVMDSSKFPRKLVFPSKEVLLGQSCTKVLPLSSNCPVDFEFQITVLQSHPSFSVDPLTGVVPGEGVTNINVTFTPTEYITAHMAMQLVVSQFNTKPFMCNVTASCSPSQALQLTRSVKDFDELYKQTKLLDPRCLSPVQIARRRQKATSGKNITPKLSELNTREFQFDGHLFPHNINTQHAVNSVLLQEKGKLRMKDLRDAIAAKAKATADETQSLDVVMSVRSTRQMKEAAFEKMVRRDVVEERANQLRWQVHLGQRPMPDAARLQILEQREVINEDYKFVKLKTPWPAEELLRPTSQCTLQRTVRQAGERQKIEPKFDMYKNNPWSVRHRALERFQQAARTILIRRRADKKVVMLRKMIEDFNNGLLQDNAPAPSGMNPFQVEPHEGGTSFKTPSHDISGFFTPEKVKPFAFPVYVSPDTKEDIAPDALGEVPVDQTEVQVKRDVPFHDLVVPQYYHVAGYERHDVTDALTGYVPPGLARRLRTGAEDEIIKITLPAHLTQTESVEEETENPSSSGITTTMKDSSVDNDVSGATVSEQATSSGLIPPPALFNNPRYHKLHIFNRTPGLVNHHTPLPQSELDSDYHLCPMPRYTMLPGATKYLDRGDVIKGVMNWKKLSSHGLGSLAQTPSLIDVWLPRWSDCFSEGIVPSSTPGFLPGLPKEDEANLLDEENPSVPPFPLLTPEMINSNFITEEKLEKERDDGTPEEAIKEATVNTARVPSEVLLHSTSKESRLEALESFVQNKFDRLGAKVRNHLKTLDLDYEQ